jgi:putative lipoic acid-binding regulatory protein
MGDPGRITQYSPESTKALHNDFEASKSDSVEFEREDPLNIYLSVDGGMFGGCCGAPYIDTENRVVAFHLYSGDDSIPVKVAVIKEAAKTAVKGTKRSAKGQDTEDVASSNGGYASVKQGLIISKLEKLVCAVRELLGIDLNSDVVMNAVVFDPQHVPRYPTRRCGREEDGA